MRRNLINVVWTLIYKESVQDSPQINPLIPRLLEKLHSFNRDIPISRVEYLELYQIQTWVSKMLEEGRLPRPFSKCIPQEVRDAAESKFHEYDRPQFAQVQTEIAKMLLDLRVSFKENQKVERVYRVDIKLIKRPVAIVIEDDTVTPKESTYQGIYQVKKNWLKDQRSSKHHVELIKVSEWKELSQHQKLMKLMAVSQLSAHVKDNNDDFDPIKIKQASLE